MYEKVSDFGRLRRNKDYVKLTNTTASKLKYCSFSYWSLTTFTGYESALNSEKKMEQNFILFEKSHVSDYL